MIISDIKETTTETEKIYEYETVLSTGVHAFVTVKRPVLSAEEYKKREKMVEQALQRYAKSVIASGVDWHEAVENGRKITEEQDEKARKWIEKLEKQLAGGDKNNGCNN